jgi:DNA repair protein RecO (recombination protein O)
VGGILKDRAVILRTWEYGETSLVVSALTKEGGKSNFLAKGAKRAKSPMHGRFRTGNIGDIVYYDKPGRALKLVKEFSAGPVLDSSGADFERLCIFQAGLELAGRAAEGDEQDGSIFDLVEAFSVGLAHGADPWAAFFVLETMLLSASGLMPEIELCDRCKKELAGCGFSVNPTSGAVECSGCAPGEGTLSPDSCALLEEMASAGFEGLGGLTVDAQARREIGTLLHRMLTHHMDGYRLPGSLGMLKGAGQG